jgi:hypothetical protein
MFDVAKLVNPFTQIPNPNVTINWLQNAGYTTDATGHRTPNQTTVSIQAQIQALSAGDLKHLDSLNIENVSRAVYMFGDVQGIVRADQKGGDILQFAEIPGGTVKNWLVSVVFETWPTLARVGVTLQNP